MKSEPQRDQPAQNNPKDATRESDGRGRPEMDDSERSSDPAKSLTGKQPKPSNPEGSL